MQITVPLRLRPVRIDGSDLTDRNLNDAIKGFIGYRCKNIDRYQSVF